MKPSIRGLLALVLMGAALAGAADTDKPKTAPPPAPRWFKSVDQGGDLKGYLTPEGVKLEVVADFPVVTNPVGMTFGEDGSLYVIEWRPDPKPIGEEVFTIVYKDGSLHTFTRVKKSVKDVVKVLRDTKGKGVYDQSEVILEDELPSSILVNDGWLYLSGRGSVRRYKLADLTAKGEGEAKEAKPETVALGFGGRGHGQVSGMALGPGGWLYITAGEGDHVVQGSDGSRATVLGSGAIFRCRPDGSRIEVYSIGYHNPYREVAFDASGNMFHADNAWKNPTASAGARLLHIVEDGDYGIRAKPLTPPPAPEKKKAEEGAKAEKEAKVESEAAMPAEPIGKLPAMLDLGRAAAAGLLCYNDTRFPEKYRGLLYFPDVVNQRVGAYRADPRGATFEVAIGFDLLKSEDPLFRPCQAITGPDGAIYVCDWRTDSTGSAKYAGDGKHGRIYRLRWSGTEGEAELPLRGMDSWAKIVKLGDAELLAALGREEQSDRQVASREAARRGAKLRPALIRMVVWPYLDEKQLDEGMGKELVKEEPNARARLAALSALEMIWDDSVREALLKIVRDPEPPVRRLAFEALGRNCKPGDRDVTEALLQQLEDRDPGARHALFLALGRVGAGDAADGLVNSFKVDEGRDPVLLDGMLRGIERAGRPGIAKLVALAESGDEKDHDRVLDVFIALRTRPAAEAIPGLLKYPHLTARQRVDLLRSFGDYRLAPPLSAEPVIDYLTANADAPTSVKVAGLEVLAGSPVLGTEKGQKLLTKLFEADDAALRKGGIAALGSRASGARVVAELLLSRKLPAELREPIAEALQKHADKDKEAKRLLEEVKKGG